MRPGLGTPPRAALALAAFVLAWGAARAAGSARLETVTLDVEGMTCAMCPITVRRALERVPGVTRVEAEYEGDGRGWARVTFDPARARVEDLTRATRDAGYPSRPQAEAGDRP